MQSTSSKKWSAAAMRRLPMLVVLAGIAISIGCTSMTKKTTPFTDVSLKRDLREADLSRYTREAEDGVQPAHGQHPQTLERTNWWPAGLFAFWKRGTVQALPSAKGNHYLIEKTHGFGPLSMLFVFKEQAIYNQDGKRKSYAAGGSMCWGHMAGSHSTGLALDDGQWLERKSFHVMHHFINFGESQGKGFFSLGCAPNPAGVDGYQIR